VVCLHTKPAVLHTLSICNVWPHACSRRYGDQSPPGECLARLVVFGSFCSRLFHKGSDLDLTITGRWRNNRGTLLEMVRACATDLCHMLLYSKSVSTPAPRQRAICATTCWTNNI
jgi:hypothetical protein